MTKQEEILHLLVKKLGGHSVTIIREGVGELVGFSVGKGRSIAIDDLIAVVFEPAPSPQTHLVAVPRDRLLKLLEYSDAEYVPNSLFSEFRTYLDNPAPQTHVTGVELAARFVEKRLNDYCAEHGVTDPDTGTVEYPGNGEEYVYELEEIIEGIRALSTKGKADA